jgi:serine/threonine protein kinase
MGQTEAKSNTHDYAKFKEKYEIKKKLVDKKYGEGMLIEDKTTKSESFQNEFAPISAAQFQELFAKICNKENIKNPYIIDIIDYFMHRDTHYCSETYKIYVLFEFCNKNLESEIIDRVSDDIRRFSNEEMVYITESYITGLSFLQNNHIPHSSLSLHSLLISKSGIYKVADQTILNMPSNFEQVQSKKTDLKGVYLSPAQISVLILFVF